MLESVADGLEKALLLVIFCSMSGVEDKNIFCGAIF